MPFIKDFKGKTRLHYCIEEQNKDLKTADFLLNYLSSATLDHHSRDIADVLPNLILENIPSLTNYLQRRMISNEYLDQFERGEIKITSQ
jgi:hypothetical protein